MVLVYIVLVAGVASLLAMWCGWGLARLTLPAVLRPWELALAPLMGYALVLVAGYWGVHTVAGLPAVLAVLLPVAGALNFTAWRRTGPPRVPAPVWPLLPVGLLLIATFLVGVAPLLNYGYPAIIGGGWDVEDYLPVARYLERGPVSAIASAPPNPLRDLNAHPPRIGLTLGFSIWHGSVDVLTGSEALASFPIVIAWLRALGVLGVYVLLRAVMGLRRGYALAGTALVSAGALLLWVGYFNFGMQMSAWPLLPLGLVVGWTAVQEVAVRGLRSAWPVLVGAATALGAMPVAYYPAITLFVPVAAGLGVGLFVSSPRRLRMRLLASAAVVGLVSVLVVLPTVADYFEGFSYRYSQQLTTLGLFRYIPLTDIVGFTPFDLYAKDPPPVPVWAWVALGALAGLMLAGLAWGTHPVRWLGLAVGAGAYLAWLRWGQQYPYAYMKGAAYAAFPFLGLAAAGAQALADRLSSYARVRTRAVHVVRVALAGVILVLLAAMASAQYQIVADHWPRPRLYAAQMPDLLSLRSHIPAGSRVSLTTDPRIDSVTFGLAAYFLDHTTVLGSGQTGYSGPWAYGQPDEVGDYGLLTPEEDPELRGFSPDRRVWAGGSFVLYRRDPALLARLPLTYTLSPGGQLALEVGDEHLSTGTGGSARPAGTGQPRQIELALASFGPSRLSVDGISFDILAGGSTLVSMPLATPHEAVVRNEGTSTVVVRWASVLTAIPARSPGVTPQPAVALAQAQAQVAPHDGHSVHATLQAQWVGAGPLVAAIDIWDTPRGLHYGWYGLELPHSQTPRAFTLTLDLRSGNMSAVSADGGPVPVGGGPDHIQPGDYTALLTISAGPRLLAASSALFTFSVGADGSISNLRVGGPQAVATRADRPVVPLDVQVGDDVRLLGYALSDTPPRAGEQLALTLWWQAMRNGLDARSVLLHLRDASGSKRIEADGPPAGGGRPTTAWQAGEVVVDVHTIPVPADLPPGWYSIAVGMYHYPSLELLPLTDTGTRLPGDVVLIPVQVK